MTRDKLLSYLKRRLIRKSDDDDKKRERKTSGLLYGSISFLAYTSKPLSLLLEKNQRTGN
jgi:hypothetical protein